MSQYFQTRHFISFHVACRATTTTRRYTIITTTSDIRGAGTDANVSCMLFGDKANTPTFVLSSSKNDFEKGQVDEFVVETIGGCSDPNQAEPVLCCCPGHADMVPRHTHCRARRLAAASCQGG